MAKVLSDHNCEGQAQQLLFIINQSEYVEFANITLDMFKAVKMPYDADDETVWRFCQDNGYFLLTGNRSSKDGDDSLEAVIRRNYHAKILPVLTIGDLSRIGYDKTYREDCAVRLIEIVLDTIEDEKYLGVMRLYLPD